MKFTAIRFIAACFALVAAAFAANAQEAYPSKTISLIVPYGAGGGTDLLARVIADEMTNKLGQKVLVENVPGAGGTLGTRKVMGALPDGYSLLLGSGSELELMQITEPQADLGKWTPLAPVALLGTQPMVLVGRSTLPANTMNELLAMVKAKPGSLSYASAGVGTQLHVLGELLKMEAGLDIPHIPYKAAGQIAADVVGGHVDLAVMVLPSVLPFVRSGKMKAYGVSDAQRSPAAPDIPAMNETKGFEKVDMKIWYGVFAPAGVPQPVAARLAQTLKETMQAPAVRAKLSEMAITVAPDNSGVRLTALKTAELAKIRKVFEAIRVPAAK